MFGESGPVQCQSDYYLVTNPVSADIGIIFMSPDMLSVPDVPGWSPACIFFSATPSDSSPLWWALPLWPTAATYHPRLFPRSLFPIATITCSIWALSEKAKLPVNVSRSDFFGRDKESLEKVDRSTAENDLFVCWLWVTVLSTLALCHCLVGGEVNALLLTVRGVEVKQTLYSHTMIQY